MPHRSALPSRRSRIFAFLAICLAGVSGGIIGYSYESIQCDEDCGLSLGLYTLLGAVVASVGIAILVVLILRAMEEWKSQNKNGSGK